MTIIEGIEKNCLSLERMGETEKADTLRHEIADHLIKAKKPISNLTSKEKKGLSYLRKNSDQLAIVPFDKGQGLVSIERKKLVEKSEKEFKNVSKDTKDTTQADEAKLQRKLRDLHKQGKVDTTTYKEIYPSGSLTPTANPAIKAHKPEKDFPARLITSHIGAPQEALASHLNGLLKPYIDKSTLVCKNSNEFVQQLRNIKIGPNDKMISFDAAALFPSVPIQDAINHVKGLLDEDQDLKNRTKLTPLDITDLISFCLSTSNFSYDGRHHTQRDSGPIGLSLMVTISQIWMIHTLERAIEIADSRKISRPCHLTSYIDDYWCVMPYPRPGLRSSDNAADPAIQFNECLNQVHPRVQFTREEEKDNNIAFLDVSITCEEIGSLPTTVYCKPSNTNITIKPASCQHPRTAISTFKAELCRAHRICSSPMLLEKEKEFVINLFADNGHEKSKLREIANTYKPATVVTSRENKSQKCMAQPTTNLTEVPKNLFDILPFRDCDLSNKEEKKLLARIPYLLGNLYHQIRHSLDKAGFNTYPTSGQKLVLRGKNKTLPPPIQKKGVYRLDCQCNEKAVYVGQTIRSIANRCQEHKKASEKGNWQHSGISQHKEHCDQIVDWESPKVLATMSGKNKKRLAYDLKVREALEIKRHNCGPGHGLNEDLGAY